jgi:DNA-directed RNA polymerase beta subunit
MNWKKEGSEIRKRCMSRFIPSHEAYTVVAVEKYPADARPPIIVRVSLSKVHIPAIGDKFFFAHAQKGTISQLTRSYDLPFYETGPRKGLSPQVITNVACLARTTMGLQLEMACSDARAMNPSCMSQYETLLLSNASQQEKLKICQNVMLEAGMSYTGRKPMINGQNGKRLWCDVYTGFAYCHVLKHMAENKLRSRERGAVCQLTRQTSVGKRMSGGQRAGVSEMNNLYSYGASATIQSLFHDSGDSFVVYVCKKCQVQAIGNAELGVYHCRKCRGGSESLVRLNSNYITNLTFQELAAAGFGHKLKVRPCSDPFLVQADEARICDATRRAVQ